VWFSIEPLYTLIFSTHSPAQALRLTGVALYLEGGCLMKQGPAEELFNSPKDERTRAFLGHWRLNKAT